jgi:predicted nuclease of predicted toxin-antitoxin system
MNIKLDENLPLQLAALLKNLGHDVHTVQEERLVGHADSEIWESAQKESRFLITQDLDFSIPGALPPVRITASCLCDFTRRIEEV